MSDSFKINTTILQDSFKDASRKHEQLNAEFNHHAWGKLHQRVYIERKEHLEPVIL